MPSNRTPPSSEVGIKRDTTRELIENVVELVKQNGYFQEIEPILDYFISLDTGRELTRYEFDFCAAVHPGPNEGTFIDVSLEGTFDQSGERRIRIATFKSLNKDIYTFRTMGALCGTLSYYAHEYINKNIERYCPPEKLEQHGDAK